MHPQHFEKNNPGSVPKSNRIFFIQRPTLPKISWTFAHNFFSNPIWCIKNALSFSQWISLWNQLWVIELPTQTNQLQSPTASSRRCRCRLWIVVATSARRMLQCDVKPILYASVTLSVRTHRYHTTERSLTMPAHYLWHKPVIFDVSSALNCAKPYISQTCLIK